MGIALALALLPGCKRTQLRVIASEQEFREGTLTVTAKAHRDDIGQALMHAFTNPARTSASFLFTFNTVSRWSFLTEVTTHFTPTTPRDNECIFQCTHYLNLEPGHAYRVETPIFILPHACPPTPDFTAATEVCAEANSLVRLPNCQFMVTSEHTCSFMCFGPPPTDDAPDDPADETAQTASNVEGPPNTPPSLFDAGPATGHDAGMTEDAGTDAPTFYDVPPPNELDEPPM